MAALSQIKSEQSLTAYQRALAMGHLAKDRGNLKNANVWFDYAEEIINACVVQVAEKLAKNYNMEIEIKFDKSKSQHLNHCINFIGGTDEQQAYLAMDIGELLRQYAQEIEKIPMI